MKTVVYWMWIPGLYRHASTQELEAGVADKVANVLGVAFCRAHQN